MTRSKDYLVRVAEFKACLPSIPVDVRKKWIGVLKTRKKTIGLFFRQGTEHATEVDCDVCVIGALKLSMPPNTSHLPFYDGFPGYPGLPSSVQLNDVYKVPFTRFIGWIRESLSTP